MSISAAWNERIIVGEVGVGGAFLEKRTEDVPSLVFGGGFFGESFDQKSLSGDFCSSKRSGS